MKNKMEFKIKKPLKKNSPSPVIAKIASLQNKDSPANNITHLQRTIGNQAVQRLFKSDTLQAKLEIGKPNDKYEKEADRIADIVMRMPEPYCPTCNEVESIKRQPEEEEEEFQANPIAEQITPLVQRQEEEPEEEEEEEPIQAKPVTEGITAEVQRQEEEPEEEEEEEPVQTKLADDAVLQRQEEPEEEEEEEPIQTKTVAEGITPEVQRQEEEPEEEEEEEEPIQAKSNGPTVVKASRTVESSINSLSTDGQPLSKSVRNYFEPRFGYDFSEVRVHTDSKASEAAKSINARAFTKGRSIVFGVGQYLPETTKGKSLLGHELTHVVQQGHIGRKGG